MSSLFVFLTCCDAKVVLRKTLNIHMLTNSSFQWMRAWLNVLKVNVGGFICVLCLSQRALVSAPAELADPLSLLSALSHVSSPHTHSQTRFHLFIVFWKPCVDDFYPTVFCSCIWAVDQRLFLGQSDSCTFITHMHAHSFILFPLSFPSLSSSCWESIKIFYTVYVTFVKLPLARIRNTFTLPYVVNVWRLGEIFRVLDSPEFILFFLTNRWKIGVILY